MPNVARLGDADSGGGSITGIPQSTVYANNLLISVDGSSVSGHGPGIHAGPATANGSASVYAKNIPINVQGNADTCGHARVGGSSNVFVGMTAGTFGIASVSVNVYIPEGDQLAAETLVGDYVTAQTGQPNVYYKPAAAADGVKGNYAGTPESTSVPDGAVASDPTESDLIPFLDARLAEAATGYWRETGQGGAASNPKIIGIWTNLGYPASNPWTTDQTAWCMGFVNYALKNCGYKYVQTASAAAITTTPEKWSAVQVPKAEARPGDIAFWSYRHVNFVYTAANGKYSFVGGNQTPSGGKNNPDDGGITISYPGGTAASNANWVSCWRITKT